MEIEIYWYDLTEDKQQELIAAGFDNANVTGGCHPFTTVYIEED